MSDEGSLLEDAIGSRPEHLAVPARAGEVTPSAGCGCARGAAEESQKAATTASGGCGCASCKANSAANPTITGSSTWVYALGRIGYDLITEARHDAIREAMGGEGHDPSNPARLLAHLKTNPWDAAAIQWTLTHDQVPIYVILPAGPYARETFDFLIEALRRQVEKNAGAPDDHLAVPGRLAGQARLLDKNVVPVILADRRGMRPWNLPEMVVRIAGPDPVRRRTVEAFLARVIHDLRGRGVTPGERAVNYAATTAAAIGGVFDEVLKSAELMELDSISVEPSPACRPDSDCHDVKLFFFYPGRQVQTVRMVYRFTVDVSDVVPVRVGPIRSWSVR